MGRKIYFKEEVRMLTCDEYILNQQNIPPIESTWWLSDKGAGSNFGFVVGLNEIYKGDFINNKHEIRPIYITTASSVVVGEEITAYDIEWIKYAEVVEDKYTTRHYYISKNSIGCDIFDEKSNIFDNSHIKRVCEDRVQIIPELDETEKEKAKRLKKEAKEAQKKEKLEKKRALKEEKKMALAKKKEEKKLEKQ